MENDIAIKKDIHQVNTKWVGKMHFTSMVNEHTIHMDKLPQHGGDNFGPRPKPLILSAIGGCTGMEIMAILEKMRLRIEALDIDVSGTLSDDQPKVYKSIHLVFKIRSNTEDKEKIQRAVNLAYEKYCGVVAMAKKMAEVSSEIIFS